MRMPDIINSDGAINRGGYSSSGNDRKKGGLLGKITGRK